MAIDSLNSYSDQPLMVRDCNMLQVENNKILNVKLSDACNN